METELQTHQRFRNVLGGACTEDLRQSTKDVGPFLHCVKIA